MRTVYVAEVISEGGRTGRVESAEGELELLISPPDEDNGGLEHEGSNPEQLFASAYASCFHASIESAASRMRLPLKGSTVIARVALNENDEGGRELAVELRVSLPGMNRAQAEKALLEAHQTCPYSKALRGNVDVEITLD